MIFRMAKYLQAASFAWILLTIYFTQIEFSASQCSSTQNCSNFACCSEWGNCGYGPDYCGEGCVNDCTAKPECGPFAVNPSCPLNICCGPFNFCGTTPDFCGDGCQNNCFGPPPDNCSPISPLLRIGYYASWAENRTCYPFGVKNIDVASYTHLNYAFAAISNGVMVTPEGRDKNALTEFASLKGIKKDIQLLVSVGGWAFNDPGPTQLEFHNIAASASTRAKFIQSVHQFLEMFQFNGIDIDWEYPGASDRGGFPEDGANYVLLLKEMREAFKNNYLITIAAPASYWYLRHFDIAGMSEYLDWINVMSYDYHGVWDADRAVRPHTDIREIADSVKLFRKAGAPAEKLVLGLGNYGRAFTLMDEQCVDIGCEFSGPSKQGNCTQEGGILALFEISEIILNRQANPRYHNASGTKILVFDKDQWVSYDDDDTFQDKTEFAGKNCLKGVMIWSIDQGMNTRLEDNSSAVLKGTGLLVLGGISLLLLLCGKLSI